MLYVELNILHGNGNVLHATQRPREGRKSGLICDQVVEFMSDDGKCIWTSGTRTLVYPSLYFSDSMPNLSRMVLATALSFFSLSAWVGLCPLADAPVWMAFRTPLMSKIMYLDGMSYSRGLGLDLEEILCQEWGHIYLKVQVT